MRSRLILVSALAAFSFLLAACTNGNRPADDGAASDSETSDSDGSASLDGNGASESNQVESGAGGSVDDPGDAYVSPLNQYLGIDLGKGFEAERIEADRRVEEAIAACMRAEGFEYTQRDPTDPGFYDGGFGNKVDANGLREGTVEWAVTYGFGFSTLAFPQSQVGPELLGYDQEQRQANLNPNADYVANLSPEERSAYRAALSGTADDYENADDANPFRAFGCSGEANEKHGLNLQERQISLYEEFGDDLSEIAELATTPPTVLAVEREVLACIAERGYELIDSQTAASAIKVRLGPVYDAANSLRRTDEEVAAGVPYAEFPDKIKELLAEVQRDEINHATAIYECGGGATGRYNDALSEVRNEMQQDFIDDNQDRLDAFILAQG